MIDKLPKLTVMAVPGLSGSPCAVANVSGKARSVAITSLMITSCDVTGAGGGGGGGGAPLRDHLWQGPPLPVTLRLIHPPPKMTQGVMTPLTPLHHLPQHPCAGSHGVGIATLIFS